MRDEDDEAKTAIYAELIASKEVRALVSTHIGLMHDGYPPVGPADVAAAQTYLKACIDNMTLVELDSTSDDHLAALWARGCVGAALYRARMHRSGRGHRARDDVDDDR